ncbi:MAG: hypothetical protein J2P37_06900 [Ktedonobacteraceae bacterium]|nr:hypothetical protein [Ktedonobacteraceae bacterium]MBO0792365.1 hypothetical protein [Ktedonobacteraceae bacterium]
MQENEQQPLGPCSICGADGRQRVRTTLVTQGNLKVTVSEGFRFVGSGIEAVVCTSCGNIQLFTNPQEFKRDWRSHKPYKHFS